MAQFPVSNHLLRAEDGASRMDAIDRRILAILQENGRLSNQEIAERVNLSPARACGGSGGSRRSA